MECDRFAGSLQSGPPLTLKLRSRKAGEESISLPDCFRVAIWIPHLRFGISEKDRFPKDQVSIDSSLAADSTRGRAAIVDSRTISSGSTVTSTGLAPPWILCSRISPARAPILSKGCRTVVRLGIWNAAL